MLAINNSIFTIICCAYYVSRTILGTLCLISFSQDRSSVKWVLDFARLKKKKHSGNWAPERLHNTPTRFAFRKQQSWDLNPSGFDNEAHFLGTAKWRMPGLVSINRTF